MDSSDALKALDAAAAAQKAGAPAPLPRWVPPVAGLAAAAGIGAFALPGTVVPATGAWQAAMLAVLAVLITAPVLLITRYRRQSGRNGQVVVPRAHRRGMLICTLAGCVIMIAIGWTYGSAWGLAAGAPFLGGSAWIQLAASARPRGGDSRWAARR